MKRRIFVTPAAGTVAILMLFVGCAEDVGTEETPPVRTAVVESEQTQTEKAAPTQADSNAAGKTATKAYAGLRFEIPAEWEELELTAMQRGIIAARFSMPTISEDLTLTLSRSGGSINDNLNRWRGQVETTEPERSETVTVVGKDASLVDLKGRFAAGFGQEPEDGWRMVGVIVPMEPQSYFIKLTGPIEAVTAAEDAFHKFLESARQD